MRRILTLALCLIGAAAGGDATAAAASSPAAAFAACAPAPGQPWTYAALMCVRQAGTTYDVRDEAVRRLRALGAGDAAHPWPTLVLAHVTLDRLDRDRAIALYAMAAEAFARSGEAEGEVIARQNLASQLRLRGDPEGAARHVARAVAAADASKQPLLVARAAVIDAVHSMATGGDIGRARRVLLRADSLVTDAAPIGLRRTILFNLANASLYLGDADAAVDALERHRALRAEDQSPQNAATVEFNLLTARMMVAERRPTAEARGQLIAGAEAVLAEATALHEPLVEAQAHQVLGDLLAATAPDQAVAHLRRCLAIERGLRFPSLRAACLWSLSRHEARRHPLAAQQASEQALALLDSERDRMLVAFAWQARLRLVWRSLPEDAAVTESMAALDAIERLRSAQASESSRAGLFGNWTRDYQWLTGQLLQAREPRLAQAFEVGERLRARVLLERLAQAGAPDVRGAEDTGPGAPVDRRIAGVQRQLLSASLTAPGRRTLLDQLRLLELERDEDTADRVAPLPASAISFASLGDVQRLLGRHEAMVWFSVAPWTDLYGDFGGGAWAVAITPDATRVHRLRVDSALDSQVAGLIGLLRERDTDPTLWAPATRRLGDILFAGVLAALPATTTSLVLVTDGPLHRLPFDVLSPGSGPMLGERYDLSETPSATIWVRTRARGAAPVPGGVLVLADPDVRSGLPDGSVRLAALPGARREAAAIARLMRLDADGVRRGAAASERFVKSGALDAFGVLHIAAHARADTAFPARSAVFLAPGASDEDGWLQPHEIAALGLGGRLVVLSACESAEGSLLSGEGPLSLARAFFAAGARGVVATRWPLRDDDAAFMMEAFYRALADGADVAAALRQARREALAAGLPAAAWSGVAALGDGVQVPGGPAPATTVSPARIALVAALLLVASWFGWRRIRRPAPPVPPSARP